MKLVAGLALAGLANGASIGDLRGYSKNRLINLHQNMVHGANASQTEIAFIDAFAAKAATDGVPEHVYESVVYTLANGGVRTHDDSGKVWDNCPPGKCDVPVTLAEIWGYGCWCNFPALGRGSGPVLDEFDHACNFLSRCNRCTALDGENADPSYVCDAATEDFNVNVRWDMAAMGLTGDCAVSNDNDCDKHLCSCQMTFISRLLDYLWAGATVNPLNYHGNEDWNGNRCKGGEMPEVTTVPTIDPELLTTAAQNQDTVHTPFTVDQGHDHHFICCGFYPDRFSYNTDTWGCCQSEELRNPYKHATEQCCESGEVVAIGDAC
jgi:hypothetical protein